jgi:hypothetical protein
MHACQWPPGPWLHLSLWSRLLCFDTYSPVCKNGELSRRDPGYRHAQRVYDWDTESFDFKGAYLNRTLNDDEDILHVRVPLGARLGGSTLSSGFTSHYLD